MMEILCYINSVLYQESVFDCSLLNIVSQLNPVPSTARISFIFYFRKIFFSVVIDVCDAKCVSFFMKDGNT